MKISLDLSRILRWTMVFTLTCGCVLSLAWADTAPSPSQVALRVAAMGDVMMGTENLLPENGGVDLFTEVIPYLKDAQVVFCNHESALTDKGAPTKSGGSGRSYCFRTPPKYARHLKSAGFNMVSIANNHVNDYGEEGKNQTIQTLESHGIAWSGPPETVALRRFNGLKVAMVAYHSSSHSNHLLDIPTAEKFIRDLSQQNDIVIVSFHGGAEGRSASRTPKGPEKFLGEERGDVRRFSHAMVDAGADLVIGHGPHVPRAMEVYRQRLIAYSLGNFCTMKGINVKGINGLAPLLLVDLDREGKLVGGKIVSFKQTMGNPPKLDPSNKAAVLIHQLGQKDVPGSNAVDAKGLLQIPPPPDAPKQMDH